MSAWRNRKIARQDRQESELAFDEQMVLFDGNPMSRKCFTDRPLRLVLLSLLLSAWSRGENLPSAVLPKTRTALLRGDQADADRLLQLQREGFTSIALMLTSTNAEADALAVKRIRRAGLELDYWIEVARSPALADAHPEWMASIQTHQEWRRQFPQFAPTPSNCVVKVYPWVPVLYRETFDAQLRRITQLLDGRPAPRRLFLNDLQAAPSACGCGNPLCRWTPDYGQLKSATRLGGAVAAQFLAAVRRLHSGVETIPVWTTECEEHDREGLCGGVGCFHGACWDEWTGQLNPVAAQNETIGVLLLYRVFERDLPIYGKQAGWITSALGFFQKMPLRYQPEGFAAGRLLAVLQGWDVGPEQTEAQVARAIEAGAAGVIVAFAAIDQSWSPRLVSLANTEPAAPARVGN
jgi:hypothetical protein